MMKSIHFTICSTGKATSFSFSLFLCQTVKKAISVWLNTFFSLHSSSSCFVDYIKILKSLLNGPFFAIIESGPSVFKSLLFCTGMYTYVCYTYSETTSKKVSNPFFSSSLKLCTYTRVRACFFYLNRLVMSTVEIVILF